jgi:hypothetical protein
LLAAACALASFTQTVATVGAGRLAVMVITSMPSAVALLSCAELAGAKPAARKNTAITDVMVLVFMVPSPCYVADVAKNGTRKTWLTRELRIHISGTKRAQFFISSPGA